ncbi:MAG: S8 family peptidase [Gammaproteobacteria bacterium]|nr:S8 family peptidase [Gammaproteobacteria bacterium]
MALGKLPHIVLTTPPETSLYTTTSSEGGDDKESPFRNRIPHGQYLQNQFNLAWRKAEEEQAAVGHGTRNGIYLEFKSDPNFELEIKSLENLPKRIRLLNVREKVETVVPGDDGEESTIVTTFATVYVPHEQKMFFLDRLGKYLESINNDVPEDKPKHAKLIDSISDIQKALMSSFWVDEANLFPTKESEWIEVWLSSDEAEVMRGFEALLAEQEIQTRVGDIKFPERAVKVIKANGDQLEKITELSDHIAEYRKAKTTAAYWVELKNKEQADWVENLLERCNVDVETQSVVCILDTGINNGHPLLRPVLSDNDCQAVDPAWGTHDHDKHGTLMAGLVAYGDLEKSLESTERIELTHRLESIKILPLPPEQNEPNLWGYITSQAINLAEIQEPDRNRSICMAVTAEDTRDRGRPSSWSAELDQLSSSSAEDDAHRLIIVSAGNTTTSITETANQYPVTQLTDSVHDPAQSWNALTVGAYTGLDQITDTTLVDYKSVAPKNGLSPFSTTSMTWEENKWPIKPELVLEGGNLAIDSTGFVTECEDLSLLSTFYDPQQAHFHHFNMTSAATAQLGWMAGKLQALNPDFWPETIRALLVHSAEWPEVLKNQFIDDDKKTSFKHLLSICGYGVPNLERAMHSTRNSLTLIAQSTLQPFDKNEKGKSGYRTKDMHLYELPWPKEVLLSLHDDTPVEMRITLSYFVEPGPGEVGWRDRYRYASHALRFELNSPGETKSEFVKRINKATWDADEGKPETKSPSDHWVLGSQARNRGSIHSDIWKGTAAALADSNLIAVSPTIGWWRERSHLGRWNKKTRYTLVVSITTPDEEVDVYTPVAIQVGIPVVVEI